MKKVKNISAQEWLPINYIYSNGIIKINSSVEKINSIIVYDILGKEVFTKTNINSNEFNISDIITQNQSLIVKLTLVNGNQITKKIVF